MPGSRKGGNRMDPLACLASILDGIGSLQAGKEWNQGTGDREEIADRLRALADWIDRGGFLPAVRFGPDRLPGSPLESIGPNVPTLVAHIADRPPAVYPAGS